jgi:SAM-dependent methyltransferase
VEPEEYTRTAEAEGRHFWFRELRWIWRGLAPRAESGFEARALDAGCGTGENLRRLEGSRRATGVDLSPLALAVARGKARSPLARATISNLPFRDESFDLILCADVIYHADVADDVAALREMRRVLKRGGSLIVNVPAFEGLRSAHDRAVHTARRYDRAMLRDRLAAAGFAPKRVLYWNSLLLPVAALVRRIRRDDPGGSDIVLLPGAVNAILTAIARIDAALALLGLFPAGLSVAAAARKES